MKGSLTPPAISRDFSNKCQAVRIFIRIYEVLASMGDPSDEEVETEAKWIMEKSLGMDDQGPIKSVDGECVRCSGEAVWRDPVSDSRFCEKHAKEFFRERHG